MIKLKQSGRANHGNLSLPDCFPCQTVFLRFDFLRTLEFKNLFKVFRKEIYYSIIIPDALYQMHYTRYRFRFIIPCKFRVINNMQLKKLKGIKRDYKKL